MREIKFRAWDVVFKKMLPIACLYFDKSSDFVGVYTGIEKNDEWTVIKSEHIKLMQYTGLKDKNGIEIYEGDVLRVWRDNEYIPNRDSGGGIVDYDCESGFSQIGKVGFEGCSFDYSTIKTLNGRHEEIHLPIDWLDNFEVIGNVYENPEILEVSNNV